jgi:lipopolysaccharide export system protein LptA
MNRFSLILLCALQLLGLGYAYAEKADADKPTNVEADKMAYDDVKQVNTFSGGVILTRGTLTMRAGKVVVRKDPAGYQYATLYAEPGSVATFRQKRDGGDNLWIEGQAERIEYDGKTEMVKLYTNAKIRRLDGTKVIDEVEGAFISYDTLNEFFSVNNTATGVSKPGAGRVSATIQPRSDTKDNK